MCFNNLINMCALNDSYFQTDGVIFRNKHNLKFQSLSRFPFHKIEKYRRHLKVRIFMFFTYSSPYKA